jgi:pimeloyl-ACP methyl ester carboxylesterase
MTISDVSQLYTTHSVVSKDGTTIGYRQMGGGPALILVHGAMQAAQNFMKLAEALSGAFTVIIPDRRGRGMSGPYGDGYTIQKAVDDMRALLAETGAHDVFGLSAGAVIVLQSALMLPEIHRLAVYEPPLPIDGSMSPAWVTRYDREFAAGNLAAAMVTVMKGTGDTSIFTALPRFITVPLLTLAFKGETRDVIPGDVSIVDLIPTMHQDAHMVFSMADTVETFRDIRADVLLLGGSKSAAYLKFALGRLEDVLPHVQRVEFPGFDHIAADNSGHPERVAEELLRFFTAP